MLRPQPAAFAYHQLAVRGRTFASPEAQAVSAGLEDCRYRALSGPLGQDGIADRSRGGGFRRPVVLHLAPLSLPDGRTVTEADLVLIEIDLHDLEIVFAARRQIRSRRACFGCGAPYRGATLLDLRDVTQAFDALGQLDKCAEGRKPGDLAAHQSLTL